MEFHSFDVGFVRVTQPHRVLTLDLLVHFMLAEHEPLLTCDLVLFYGFLFIGWTDGWMQSSFLWGYTFSSILGGVLADRYGGKRVMAWGVAVWSLATLLTPWAADHSTAMLLAARALFGLAEGVALPSMNTLLSRLEFKPLTNPSLFSPFYFTFYFPITLSPT